MIGYVRDQRTERLLLWLGQRRPPTFSASFIDRSIDTAARSIGFAFRDHDQLRLDIRSGLPSPPSRPQPIRKDRNTPSRRSKRSLSPNHLAQTKGGREFDRSTAPHGLPCARPVRTHSWPPARSSHHHAHPYQAHRCGLGAPAVACQEPQPHKQAAAPPRSLSRKPIGALALTRSTSAVYP